MTAQRDWPLWEVFVRGASGLDHKHCGSLHAPDGEQALNSARDIYTRRREGVSIWVVRSDDIVASAPDDVHVLFDAANNKAYRHPSFFELPAEVEQM
jgi:ring-1,2-phenylacetyl-CoA epoxidase subunit PaaB